MEKRCLKKYLWRVTITVSVIVISFFSCGDKSDNMELPDNNMDTVPTIISTDVSTLISDSGITRYRLLADLWLMYEQAKEPYWFFPEGLFLETLNADLEIESTVEADTAWYFKDKNLWKLKKNVHVENSKGEHFDSDELYWDEKNNKVYSDAFIEIKSGETELKGYGFESDNSMTNYRIYRPRDVKLPLYETAPVDSLQPAEREMNHSENILLDDKKAIEHQPRE